MERQPYSESREAALQRNDFTGTYTSEGPQFLGAQFRLESGNIYFSGSGSAEEDPRNQECLRDLYITNPRHDLVEIASRKDDLLDGSCTWVLDDPAFCQWWDQDTKQLMWIHGDPGKGKTMMMISLIKELETRVNGSSDVVAYFFCQNAVDGLNNAKGVLRGLIYFLATERKEYLALVRKEYDAAGQKIFDNPSALYSLWSILKAILAVETKSRFYLLVDAMDECSEQQNELLRLINSPEMASLSHVKWLITSRNEVSIQKHLEKGTLKVHISLELNSQSVSNVVARYIDYKMGQLFDEHDDQELADDIRKELNLRANDTFLWAALACKMLQDALHFEMKAVLNSFPPELDPLYERMLERVTSQSPRAGLCKALLRAASIALKPPHLSELHLLADLSLELSKRSRDLRHIVLQCGSFLTIREDVIYFVHLSAKEYLTEGKGSWIFVDGQAQDHLDCSRRCQKLMRASLRQNMCDLPSPGTLIAEIEPANLLLLAPVQYACCHWIDHLLLKYQTEAERMTMDVAEESYQFLSHIFIYWLEVMSLISKLSEAIKAISQLQSASQQLENQPFIAFLSDSRRFIIRFRRAIELSPLQVYSSALLFSPRESIIRSLFLNQYCKYVKILSPIDSTWSACHTTLEQNGQYMTALSFSLNGKLLASLSDMSLNVWEVETGALISSFEKGVEYKNCIAFSHDGRLLATGSRSEVMLMNVETGEILGTFALSTLAWLDALAFSSDSKLLAMGRSKKGMLELWDFEADTTTQVIDEPYFIGSSSASFSPDGKVIALLSRDSKLVRLWDINNRVATKSFSSPQGRIARIAFTPREQVLAISERGAHGSYSVHMWNIKTSAINHFNVSVGDTAVAFSPDGKQFCFRRKAEANIYTCDVETMSVINAFEGHALRVEVACFCPTGSWLATSSRDMTVKVWNTLKGAQPFTSVGSTTSISAISISPDGQRIAYIADYNEIRLWDPHVEKMITTLAGHRNSVQDMVFSPDSQLLASGSADKTVRIWNARSGTLMNILGVRKPVNAVSFSHDGTTFISGSFSWPSYYGRIWETNTWTLQKVIKKASSLEPFIDLFNYRVFRDLRTALPNIAALDASSSKPYIPDDDGEWVYIRKSRVSWIPSDHRGDVFDSNKDRIVIGGRTGLVTLLSFDIDNVFGGRPREGHFRS